MLDNAMVVKQGGITPSGSIEITENGTYDVTEKAEAVVNVSGGVGIFTSATKNVYVEDVIIGENAITNAFDLNAYLKGLVAHTEGATYLGMFLLPKETYAYNEIDGIVGTKGYRHRNGTWSVVNMYAGVDAVAPVGDVYRVMYYV